MTVERHVLVVDDEPFVLESLTEILAGEGWTAHAASGVDEARRLLGEVEVHVVVTDLSMPGGGGLAVLDAVRERGLATPVIVLTGVGTVDDAVAAMRKGAWHFLQKPVDADVVTAELERALEHVGLLAEVDRLRRRVADLGERPRLVGTSPATRALREQVARLAASAEPVLISGESGSGKSLVAEELHAAGGGAADQYVRFSCAGVPENQFDSELFGHRRGAFPGAERDRGGRLEEARGGTLVLDEVSALGADAQARLLELMETGAYQVLGESARRASGARIVATTNQDLEALVESGAFRKDLYYRLAVLPLAVPPLRERREDLPELVAALGAPELGAEALEVLRQYDWPGNVRELATVLTRVKILADSSDGAPTGDSRAPGGVPAAFLRGLMEGVNVVEPSPETLGSDLFLRGRLDALEKQLLQTALERAGGVKREAADLLGIDARNLSYYLRKHGLQGDGRG